MLTEAGWIFETDPEKLRALLAEQMAENTALREDLDDLRFELQQARTVPKADHRHDVTVLESIANSGRAGATVDDLVEAVLDKLSVEDKRAFAASLVASSVDSLTSGRAVVPVKPAGRNATPRLYHKSFLPK